MPQTLALVQFSSHISSGSQAEEAHPASEEASQQQALASPRGDASQPVSSPGRSTGLSLADPETIAVARPYLGAAHCWMASVPSGELGHGGANVLSRCGLRIFRNGNLGRSYEWAILVTELMSTSLADDIDRLARGRDRNINPGVPAIFCLNQIATEIKRTYLPRISADLITWFYHQPGSVTQRRPKPHHSISRIDFITTTLHGRTSFASCWTLIPCPPEELEMAAGGYVEL